MSRTVKPFEQYRTLLADGRSVVGVVGFGSAQFRAWVIADSKSRALALLREYGAKSPHIEKDFRPGLRLARLAAEDPGGLVFVDDPHEFFPRSVRSSSELRDYLGLSDFELQNTSLDEGSP